MEIQSECHVKRTELGVPDPSRKPHGQYCFVNLIYFEQAFKQKHIEENWDLVKTFLSQGSLKLFALIPYQHTTDKRKKLRIHSRVSPKVLEHLNYSELKKRIFSISDFEAYRGLNFFPLIDIPFTPEFIRIINDEAEFRKCHGHCVFDAFEPHISFSNLVLDLDSQKLLSKKMAEIPKKRASSWKEKKKMVREACQLIDRGGQYKNFGSFCNKVKRIIEGQEQFTEIKPLIYKKSSKESAFSNVFVKEIRKYWDSTRSEMLKVKAEFSKS